MTAVRAVEGHVPALGLEAGVVAAIVVAPEAEKNGGDEATVDDHGGYKIHVGVRVEKRSWSDRASVRTDWKIETPRLPGREGAALKRLEARGGPQAVGGVSAAGEAGAASTTAAALALAGLRVFL